VTTSPTADTERPPVRAAVEDQIMFAAVVRDMLGEDRAPPPTIGRFVVLDRIGQGGMGTVYRGHDPDLDRPIALKLLRPEYELDEDAERLRREATALARLNHPNVVTIHEVGTTQGEIFLAMEFVDGVDLGKWCESHPVGPRKRFVEACALLVQAAEGLDAAHRAGLIHRDVKPSNVLVGADGRVRVADFGLARASGDTSVSTTGEQTTRASGDRGLTTTGVVVGTPRYMSPEQQLGRTLDARSDQFAFCVTAWEVLVGRPPWRGRPEASQPPAPPSWLPRRIAKALLRGLAEDPDARHPSLAHVTGALRPKPSSTRSIMGGAVLIAGTLGAAVWLDTGDAPCTEAEAELDAVWNTARRAEVQAAIVATDVPYAEPTWTRVEPMLDRYAAVWVAQRAEACEATLVRHEQSTSAMDRRMACLAERRRALRAFVDVLSSADAGVVERSIEAAAGLPRVELCGEADYLLTGFEPLDDPASADAATRVSDAIADATALERAGKFRDAAAMLEDIAATATELDHPPLTAELALARGVTASALDDTEEARAQLLDAYALASDAGLPRVATEAAQRMVSLLAVKREDPESAASWLVLAERPAVRSADPVLQARLLAARARVSATTGKYADALELFEQAHEQLEALLGADDPSMVQLLRSRASCLEELGRYDDAQKMIERALEAARGSMTEDHPTVGVCLNIAGRLAIQRGDAATAEKSFEDALSILRPAYGAGSGDVAMAWHGLGVVARQQGKLELAAERFGESIAAHEKSDSPSRSYASSIENLSTVLIALGRIDEAAAHAERGVAYTKKLLGAEHPDAAASLINLAAVRSRQGRFEEGLVAAREAAAVIERALGPDHPRLSAAIGSVAAILLDLGRCEEAIPVLARQLDLAARTGGRGLALFQPHHNRGACYEKLGKLEQARVDYEAALQAIEPEGPGRDPMAAHPLIGLANVSLALGDRDAAMAVATRAAELTVDADRELFAGARFAQAEALLTTDRARALDYAREAESIYAKLGPGMRENLDRTRAWLARHR
jgi:tetratricopeptide (TPR) repeat protein/predicted Ser/Thr protein kinase